MADRDKWQKSKSDPYRWHALMLINGLRFIYLFFILDGLEGSTFQTFSLIVDSDKQNNVTIWSRKTYSITWFGCWGTTRVVCFVHE